MTAQELADEKWEAVRTCWNKPTIPLDRSNIQPRSTGLLPQTTFRTTAPVLSQQRAHGGWDADA